MTDRVKDVDLIKERIDEELEKTGGVDGIRFEEESGETGFLVHAITRNDDHGGEFLLTSQVGRTMDEAYDNVLRYIDKELRRDHSFTVQWNFANEPLPETQTSYFRGTNMYEVLDKVYYNYGINEIKIYNVKMNPES